MPVTLPRIVVDTVACEQDLVITPGVSASVSIGPVTFPDSDGGVRSRMGFSSSGQSAFVPRASVQVVTTPTATILEGTTILAVQYAGGPVTLTLPSGGSPVATGFYIVDEGGNSSPTNPITVTAGTGTTNGDVTISQPFASLSISPNPTGDWFLKEAVPVVYNPDGTTTQTNNDGSTTTTLTDGTTVNTIDNANGSVTEVTVSPDGTVNNETTATDGSTSYTTQSPDGTTTAGSTETNGNYEFVATYADGTTVEEEKTGTLRNSPQTNPDGSSDNTLELDGGFGFMISRDPDGGISNFSFL